MGKPIIPIMITSQRAIFALFNGTKFFTRLASLLQSLMRLQTAVCDNDRRLFARKINSQTVRKTSWLQLKKFGIFSNCTKTSHCSTFDQNNYQMVRTKMLLGGMLNWNVESSYSTLFVGQLTTSYFLSIIQSRPLYVWNELYKRLLKLLS